MTNRFIIRLNANCRNQGINKAYNKYTRSFVCKMSVILIELKNP
jgi:hypothetical protein